jgi:hypothetical protein
VLLPRQFLILRDLDRQPRGLLLVASDQPEEQAMLWSGPPPDQNLPPHPGLARRQVCADEDGEPGWLELIPAGVLLSTLAAPLNSIEAAELFAAIADALAALHDAGLVHGGLTADHIHLDRRGRPTLLGAGQGAGDDLEALGALWRAWCPEGPLVMLSSAEDVADSLRVWLSVTGEFTAVLPAIIAERLQSPGGEAVTLHPGPAVGPVDEIGHDIGPDAGPSGLLDPLTWSGITGEPTSEVSAGMDDVTGALQEDTRINAPRTALLSRLLGLSHEQPPPERFAEGVPSEAIRALIASQTLDPLPVPDGLPARPGSLIHHRDPEWEENTATAIRAADGPPTETSPPPPPPLPAPLPEPAPAPEPAPEHTDAVPHEPTEQTTSIEVPNRLLIAAVVVAVFAGAAALFFLLSQLQG